MKTAAQIPQPFVLSPCVKSVGRPKRFCTPVATTAQVLYTNLVRCHRHPQLRHAALALAALLSWLQLSSAAHLTHAHRFCAEHGALEEANEVASGSASADLRRPDSDTSSGIDADAVSSEPESPSASAHEQCSFLPWQSGTANRPPLAESVHTASSTQRRQTQRPCHQSVPLLHFAPKASPPHALS
jgi:hypothetical protein